MKSELRLKYLSPPRINRYLIAMDYDDNRSEKLYNANIRLAQSIHPLLSQFEVIFRNSLNNLLSDFFNDSDWIINQKHLFMSDNSLKSSKYFLKNSVEKTEQKLNKIGIQITSGKVISDQTFGFWTALFLRHHYSLISGQPIKIFTHKPKSENRSSIYTKLKSIKNFRNRVNHCEPLCFKENNIDCSYLLNIHKEVYDLIKWIEPNLTPFFKNIDDVQSHVDNIMSI